MSDEDLIVKPLKGKMLIYTNYLILVSRNDGTSLVFAHFACRHTALHIEPLMSIFLFQTSATSFDKNAKHVAP